MPALRIAYMLDHFPAYSQTFVLNEILALIQQGVSVLVMARLDGRQYTGFREVVHNSIDAIKPNVIYLNECTAGSTKLNLFCDHLRAFSRVPGGYLRALLFSYRTGKSAVETFKIAPTFARLLIRRKIQHIHAHFALLASRYAMLTSLVSGIPFSFTAHAHDIFMDDVSDLIAAKCKYAKFVVTISDYNKRFLVQKYDNIRSAKIRIVHCGVDPALFEMNTAQSAGKGPFRIVSVGRLVNQKGFEPLIKALDVVRNRVGNGLPFGCRLIGDGPERDRLQSLVKTLGLTDCIEFMGALDHEVVIRELTHADLFVLPCVVEPTGAADGIPVALMEAMALGVPVISTDISGIPELVKDGGGILVPAGDVEKLAGEIEEMMRMRIHDRSEIAEKGRQIVRKEFNLACEAAKLERLFSDVAIQSDGRGSGN